MRALTLTITSLTWLLLASRATGQVRPENLDFEQGKLGRVPTGWIVPTPGYEALLTDQGARQGQRCVLLQSERGAKESAPFGNIMQVVDAGAYRGKLVRLRAAVRVEGARATDRAQLWLRVDRAGGRMGFFDNMSDRPISESAWRYHEIVGAVVDDAERLNFGLMLIQQGRVWLDDVSLEAVGEAQEPEIEPPRPLEPRGLSNLIAFTRLLGYVRYFHPSDQAAEVDWEAFAVAGLRAVESARDPEELARTLEQQFGPIAPTIRVFPSGNQPPLPKGLKPPEGVPGLQVRAWRHVGVGIGNERSVYRSWRESEAAPEGKVPEGLPAPVEPLVAELGGGVSCLVPLTLFADERGTLPHAAKSEEKADETPQRNRPGRFSGNDRATRLAAVTLAWNVFQHFYPYFDIVETDWHDTLRTALASAGTDPDERAFLDTLRRMVVQLHDGHGRVEHPSDTQRAGLPLAWDWIEDRLVVTAVDQAEGTAELHPGDLVMRIDGRPSGAALTGVEELISGATLQWRRYRALSALRLGPPGEKVRLEVEAGAGETRTVSLSRSASSRIVEEPRPEKLAELKPGVLYVDMGVVTDEDFRQALPRLEKAKGIVFDFRGYPRAIRPHTFFAHIITKPATSAQWHTPVVRRPDREGMRFMRVGEWYLMPKAPYLEARKAFITDGRAISYAESCLGIVEHYKLGEIVGGPTAGTNGNVNPFTLPGGYRVVWTGMKVLKHDGSQHHGVGILPTIPVSRTIAGVRAGRDELLEKAIKVVSE